MKREDILLALKEAEENTKTLIDNARKEGERSLARAKQEGTLKVEQGKEDAAKLKERVIAAKLASMEKEASITRERGRLKAESLERVAGESVNKAIDRLIEAFESDVDV